MEMKDSIYANTEDTAADYNADLNDDDDLWKKHQKPKISGRFRVIVVCLSVLCVVLLIAITVLWVKLNNATTEKDQLYTSCINQTEERDRLKQRLSELENHKRYFVTRVRKDWHQARDDCKKEGADLVIINSHEKQEYISKHFPGVEAWIGLIDIEIENDWKWVDGSALTTEFWWTGEPNDWQNDEDCVVTGSKFAQTGVSTWADYPCNISVHGLCEKID